MRRREVLAGASVALFGGCLSYPSGAPSGGGTTTSPTESSVDDTQFDVESADCGTVREQAAVSASTETLTVTVEGATSAQNACYSARLADATYRSDAGELRLVVETYDASDGDVVCAQCITTIEYVASVAFAAGLPDSVTVVHRSRGEEREVASTTL